MYTYIQLVYIRMKITTRTRDYLFKTHMECSLWFYDRKLSYLRPISHIRAKLDRFDT
jgi:hypothetical protein